MRIVTASDVVKYVEQNCQGKGEQWREMSWVLTLNKVNEITGYFMLSAGGTSSTTFDKKIVAKVAIDRLADGVILVHNHPSGSCLPSPADIRETGDVKNGLGLFGISLVDHIIIGSGEYYSFASEQKTKI